VFSKWFGARRRAAELKATVAALGLLPPVDYTEVIRFVLHSFDPPTTADKAMQAFSGSYLDVSNRGFAQYGHKAFGLQEASAVVLAVRASLCSLCFLEVVVFDGTLGMCGVDMIHAHNEFTQASMKLEAMLQDECKALGYKVPTWDGEVISLHRDDVEGIWASSLPESGNQLRLVERRYGRRLAARIC